MRIMLHRRRVGTRFLPKVQARVQIQSSLSQGMWMHLHLPREAIIWRGKHEPEVQNAILAGVWPGALVYDVGANNRHRHNLRISRTYEN